MPKDIALPTERGVDPRLKGVKADSDRRKQTGRQMRESLNQLRKLTDQYKPKK